MKTQSYWFKIDRKKRGFERYYTNAFAKALFEQIEPILDNWDLMQVPADVIRAIDNIKEDSMKRVYLDLYRRVGVDFAKIAVEGLKGDGEDWELKDDGMNTLLDNPDSFTWIWATQVESWVLQNVGDRIVTVTATSKAQAKKIVRDIVQQSFDEGLGAAETMSLLEDRIPIEWRKQRWRAEAIARTEVLTAAHEGSYRGAKATGLQLKKRWLARLDGREREAHAQANGQVRELDQPYDVGGEPMSRPGDIRASAANVVNCRCVEQYIRSDRQI